MKPLRVAVVGVGHLGQSHARIYRSLPGVDLAAVVDSDAARAAEMGKTHRAPHFTNFHDVLDRVDAASIAVPTEGHFDVAREFLQRRIPVLVEKPLAQTIEQAEGLVNLAREKKTALAVGHVERFNPAIASVIGTIRKPRFIECHRLSPFRFRSADIDVVLDLMIHDLDIVLHLVPAPLKKVDAVGVALLFGKEDMASARLEFEDGTVANLTASRVSDKSMRKMRIFSGDAYVSIDFLAKSSRIYRTTPQLGEALRKMPKKERLSLLDLMKIPKEFYSIETVMNSDVEPLKAELESFVGAVREGHEPVVTGEHGLRAMRAADRVLAEIRNHTWK